MKKIKAILASSLIITGVLSTILYVNRSGYTTIAYGESENAASNAYSLILNSSVTQDSSYSEVDYVYNEYASIHFSSVRNGGGVGTIDAYSTITKDTVAKGLSKINVSFTGGNLVIKTWYEKDESLVKHYYPLKSGTNTSIVGNYFSIEALDSPVTINSINLTYGCVGNETPRPESGNASLNVDTASGVYMTLEAYNNVYFGITGKYTGYIPKDIEINNGSGAVLPIKEILITAENRFTIRANLTESYLNSEGITFVPRLKYNGVNHTIKSSYQFDSGAIANNGFYDVPGARYCAYTTPEGTPSFSVQVRPIFEFNSTVATTGARIEKNRVDAGNGDHFYPYVIRLVLSNKNYNFNASKDYECIKFWDYVEGGTVYQVIPYKAMVVETINQNDKQYQVIDFYMNMIDILRAKVNGSTSFHGDQKDTFLFHFTINHAKEGNKIITNSPYDYEDKRVVLDNTVGKSAWGWANSESIDLKDDANRPFYVATKGGFKAGCVALEEMPGFGMWERIA